LAEEIGLYNTIGQAEDTWSLNEGRVEDDTFLEQSEAVIAEREKMLMFELKRFEGGLLSIVFDTPDRVQHMFWRFRDTEHPLYDKELAQRYKDVFPKLYKSMDRILGRILEDYVDDNTVLMVLSDHGFSQFHTAVHTNRWLKDAGFFHTTRETESGKANEFFVSADWSKTTAYAVGLAGIYLNRHGREQHGTVTNEQVPEVTEKLIESLLQMKDPKNGKKIVREVFRKEDIYKGPYTKDAPDLILGFEEGYRTSLYLWASSLS